MAIYSGDDNAEFTDEKLLLQSTTEARDHFAGFASTLKGRQ